MRNIDIGENSFLCHGAYALSADENGYILDRFSPESRDFYCCNEHVTLRVDCSSGVRLAMRTDSKVLAVQILILDAAREVFALDVTVDGQTQSFVPETGRGLFAFSADLPGEGEKEVVLHLPHLAVSRLQLLAIDDGASLKPVRYPGRGIAFIGDSLTQGMTCSSPTASYADQVAAALGMDYVNLSVAGAVLHAEAAKLAKKYEWDMAFLAFGTNDCAQNVSPEVFACRAEAAMRELARRKTARIFVITPIVRIGETVKNELGLNLDSYRKILHECAAALDAPNIHVIDGKKLVANNPNRFVDGLHPNDSGMREYAKNLLRTLGDLA